MPIAPSCRPRRRRGHRRGRAQPSSTGSSPATSTRWRRRRPGYAALLTPQGKILFDFIVAEADGEHGGGFCLDAPPALAADLAKRLGFYKLRAKVAIEDRSDTLGVVAGLGRRPRGGRDRRRLADPRHARARRAPSSRPHGRETLGRTPRRRELRRPPHRARRAGGRAAISPSATPSRTRPTWTSSAASISTRAAMSARRSCRACSIAAPRAPGSCPSSTPTAIGRAEGSEVTAGDKRLGRTGSAAGRPRPRHGPPRPVGTPSRPAASRRRQDLGSEAGLRPSRARRGAAQSSPIHRPSSGSASRSDSGSRQASTGTRRSCTQPSRAPSRVQPREP